MNMGSGTGPWGSVNIEARAFVVFFRQQKREQSSAFRNMDAVGFLMCLGNIESQKKKKKGGGGLD